MKTSNTKSMRAQICSALTHKWQTTPQIAAQVVFPPEVVGRAKANRESQKGCNTSGEATKANIVSKILWWEIQRGAVEKKQISSRMHYRVTGGSK